ncbi:MAG: DUF4838 domain-containing protein, partial [Planctomycetes bacterium]|nr:DUF4838 domain-containing protein [Planctomycetota bacterium]
VFILGCKGSNPLLSDEDVKFESDESFKITAKKDNGRIVTKIQGGDRVGTMYGVYRYLNKLGIRFYGLGETGTVYPSKPVFVIEDLNILENPSYQTRGFHVWGDRKCDDDFFIWMGRNRMNLWTSENQPVALLKKLGMKLADGGHDMLKSYLNPDGEYPYNHPKFNDDEDKPEDPYQPGDEYTGDTNNDGVLTYFEAHPEWYGLKEGKRIPNVSEWQGTSFCTSNEDARKEFARRVVEQFVSGQWQYVDILNFWMLDGGAGCWCKCDNCKADGTYSDKIFMVGYDILNELKRVREAGQLSHRVEISVIAYWETLDPLTKPLPDDYDYENSSVTFFPIGRCYVHSLADPACTEVNQGQLKAYQGWTMGEGRYYKGSVFIGEYYNVSSIKSLPVVFTKIMAADLPWYYRTGTRHFHYMHTPTKLWGTWTLNQYLMAALLWDINLDSTKFIDDYFDRYYPTTKETTRKVYEQLEYATANIKALKHNVASKPWGYNLNTRLIKGDLFELDHMQYDESHPQLNDGPDIVEMIDAMELAKKHLDQSLMDCKNLVEQQRLLEDKKRFDYGYAMYQYIFHMVRTSMFHKRADKLMAAREFRIVEKYAQQLKNMVDVVKVASEHGDSPNGFQATQSVKQFNEFKKLYGEK